MTSDQIRKAKPTDLSERQWLQLIALQLALMAERAKPGPKPKGK